MVNACDASGSPHAWSSRDAWPAEPPDLQPGVEGSYAGWLGCRIHAGMREAAEGGQHLQVAPPAEGRVEGGCFDQRADPGQVLGAVGDRRTEDAGGPAGRCDQPKQHPDGGRLAGPVGPDEPGHGASWHREAQLLDRADRPVGLGEAVGADRRLLAGRPGPPPAGRRACCWLHLCSLSDDRGSSRGCVAGGGLAPSRPGWAGRGPPPPPVGGPAAAGEGRRPPAPACCCYTVRRASVGAMRAALTAG
jgi:hypothetical protein